MEKRYRETAGAKENIGMYSEKQMSTEQLKTYRHFLLDLIPLLKEFLQDAKQDKKDDYNNGKVMAYIDVLSLIQMQADNFGIDLKELKLEEDVTNELFY